MLDQGNGQLSAVGFFNPTMGEAPAGEFFGGAPAADVTVNVDPACQPPGSTKTSVKLMGNVLLEPMLDSNNQPDTNIRIEAYEGTSGGNPDGVSHIRIGVYYV